MINLIFAGMISFLLLAIIWKITSWLPETTTVVISQPRIRKFQEIENLKTRTISLVRKDQKHLHSCYFCTEMVNSDQAVLQCINCKTTYHKNHLELFFHKNNFSSKSSLKCPKCLISLSKGFANLIMAKWDNARN